MHMHRITVTRHFLLLLTSLGVGLTTPVVADNVPIESALSISGCHVVVNDDDDNENDLWDKDEGQISEEDDLQEFVFTAAGIPGEVGTLTITGGSANVKLWKDDKKSAPFTLESPYSVPETGKIVTFYVEGIKETASYTSITYNATLDFDCAEPIKGKIKFGVTKVDADVDSLNDSGFAFSFTDAEDKIELSDDPDNVGKVVLMNNGDVDGDGINDAVDGVGISGGSVSGLKLTPLEITLPTPIDKSKAEITLNYNESIPRLGEGIKAVTANGVASHEVSKRGMRLWIAD